MLMVSHMGIQPWKLDPWLAGALAGTGKVASQLYQGALIIQPVHSSVLRMPKPEVALVFSESKPEALCQPSFQAISCLQ